jgi:NAD(P)H-dependent FMN reductase
VTTLQVSSEQDDRLYVAIIVGSTRPRRKAREVADWLYGLAAEREDASFEVVDIADYDLPLFDEPTPPMAGQYSQPHTKRWAAKIASFDAYIFVTPEYNHSTSAALKNAIDYLHAEWSNKAAALVGYGFDGGTRAIEHLRLILSEVKVADIRTSITLRFGEDFAGYTTLTPRPNQHQAVQAMLDDLLSWGRALTTLRNQQPPQTRGRMRFTS